MFSNNGNRENLLSIQLVFILYFNLIWFFRSMIFRTNTIFQSLAEIFAADVLRVIWELKKPYLVKIK